MPIAITTINSGSHHQHQQQQRQAIVGAGAQLMVMAALLLDLKIFVEISGTWYLLPGMRRKTYLCVRLHK